MAGRIPRLLRLHTLPGQIVFLTTVSVVAGWGITQLGDKDSSPSSSSSSRNRSRSNMQKGDIVDAIQAATGGIQAGGAGGGGLTLADALTAERGASLWWNYARDSASITARLVSRDKQSTLLVPVDKAILSLGRKPHQHPGTTYKGVFSNSKTNTERFLNAHIVEGSTQEGQVKTMLDGFTIELIKDKSAKTGWRLQPGDIEVLGVKVTSNGKIMYIDKVLPY